MTSFEKAFTDWVHRIIVESATEDQAFDVEGVFRVVPIRGGEGRCHILRISDNRFEPRVFTGPAEVYDFLMHELAAETARRLG